MSVYPAPWMLLALYEPSGSLQPDPGDSAPPEAVPGEPDTPAQPTGPDSDQPVFRPSSPVPFPRLHPRILVGYGSVFAVGMISVAWVWAIVIRGRPLSEWFPAAGWAADLLIGIIAGSAFAVTAALITTQIPALKRLERMLLRMLDMRALRWHHAVILGLLAGIPEEILFRGTVQPALGLIPSSVLFGALHAATPAYFVYATVAGLLLGGLTIWRDGLWSAIAAHTVVDIIMFLLLMRTWQRHQADTSTSTDF